MVEPRFKNESDYEEEMKRSSTRGQWSGVVCGLGKREGLVRGMERKAVRGRAHDTQTLTAFK